MQRLPHWNITDKFPALYDLESATCIEMTAKIYGAMNTLIDEYNKFADNVNAEIENFETDTNTNYELFKTALRQEFQDFINIVDLKVLEQDSKINDAVNYMKDNVSSVVKDELKNISITVDMNYDEETENIEFAFIKEEV